MHPELIAQTISSTEKINGCGVFHRKQIWKLISYLNRYQELKLDEWIWKTLTISKNPHLNIFTYVKNSLMAAERIVKKVRCKEKEAPWWPSILQRAKISSLLHSAIHFWREYAAIKEFITRKINGGWVRWGQIWTCVTFELFIEIFWLLLIGHMQIPQ